MIVTIMPMMVTPACTPDQPITDSLRLRSGDARCWSRPGGQCGSRQEPLPGCRVRGDNGASWTWRHVQTLGAQGQLSEAAVVASLEEAPAAWRMSSSVLPRPP